ncbi:MAG: aminopeptidase P family protein, partial [Holophagales bacterium]|nr:aminopeptidase P family protein [Holophagales bacterium]
GTCAAFRRLAEILAAAEITGPALRHRGRPLTVGVLRREVARVFAEHQLEQPERNILAPAEEGAMPHSLGTDSRQLRPGESLVVDLFPHGRLFADCTRTFCVGEPPEVLRDAHARVVEALELAESMARPGVRSWALQEAVCDHLSAAGWPTPVHDPGTVRGYVHGLGHGVGHELHELPSFREHATEAEGILEEGDVITLEPGLYEPEPESGPGWAVRVEDLYAVTADGVESLTPLPRHLDPRAW